MQREPITLPLGSARVAGSKDINGINMMNFSQPPCSQHTKKSSWKLATTDCQYKREIAVEQQKPQGTDINGTRQQPKEKNRSRRTAIESCITND